VYILTKIYYSIDYMRRAVACKNETLSPR